MAEESHIPQTVISSRKRKVGHRKGNKVMKKRKPFLGMAERVKKIDPKLKKFLRKKARDYNSDVEEDEEEGSLNDKEGFTNVDGDDYGDMEDGSDELENDSEGSETEEEDGEIQPGITKFSEGCRAFRMAFKSIMKKSVSNDSLGPVLSGHKKLLAEKLAEEAAERKVHGEAKKEKQLLGEKGHLKPANYLDSHEKFLISVATKGVVKLFNAVNKAQNAQKGLNPSRSKDAKVIKKRRKEAFFSELGKTPGAISSAKVNSFSTPAEAEGPSWAPLRDNYMLTSSKFKDWDKMPDTAVADDIGRMSEDSSSDDD
ncbi:hypothetical protein K2173_000595 [Erythroxylum novogranatense]|uniref:RRP15-like protein n=1 Tax=Erythroxylum novogranatense TaxID=1862640 RepID=A0AAV8S7U1_9ROSI|nr:hypothetical protein K2173_000595 [Erythroxylum novogranatense]